MHSRRFVLSSAAVSNSSAHRPVSTAGGPLADLSDLSPGRSPDSAPTLDASLDKTSLDTSLPRAYYHLAQPSHSPAAIRAASHTNAAASSRQWIDVSPASPPDHSDYDDDENSSYPFELHNPFHHALPSSSSQTTRRHADATAAAPASSFARPPSLLPPALIVSDSAPSGPSAPTGRRASRHSLFPASRSSAAHAQSQSVSLALVDSAVNVSPTASSGRASHSRSSSLGRPPNSNSLRNLNRWSNSTASSKASVSIDHPIYHRHQRSASFSRPLSVDSIGHISSTPANDVTATPSGIASSTLATVPGSTSSKKTPRKLQKARPTSIATGSPLRESPRSRSSRRHQHQHQHQQRSPRPVSPLTALPPIVKLPSLEQEVRGSASFNSRMTPQQPRPHIRQLSSTDNIQAFYFGDASPATAVNRSASAQAERQQGSPTTSKGRAAVRAAVRASTAATMQHSREPEGGHSRGHPRNRPSTAKGSADSTKSKDRSSRPPSQKAMLSRALQKANTAVQLDNAGNIEGSRLAYTEACDLLHQVLLKTPGDEDKRKLEAIRGTYTARIDELDQLLPTLKQEDSRPLPKRPRGNSARGQSSAMVYQDTDEDIAFDGDGEDEPGMQTAAVTHAYENSTISTNNNSRRENAPPTAEPRAIPSFSIPISPTKTQYANESRHGSSLLTEQYSLQSSFSRSPRRDTFRINGSPTMPPMTTGTATSNIVTTTLLQPPASPYMPPPLSPRRIPSPAAHLEEPPSTNGLSESPSLTRMETELLAASAIAGSAPHGHVRTNSHESTSWLDPIDESGGSTASSVHSRSSSRIVRRPIRGVSGATEAEFDAALDDAIEAAYDDGYEPMSSDPVEPPSYDDRDDPIAETMRRVELAKQRVRDSERETMALERELKLRHQLNRQQLLDDSDGPGNFLDAEGDSDEDERVLEGMAHGYAIEDFAFGAKSKHKQLPRGSDSSEFTNQTWHSSLASNPPTASTTLSTVTENTIVPNGLAKGATSTMPPPPTQALPQLPPHSRQSIVQSPSRMDSSQTVQTRRLSGQNKKQLKIETSKLSPPSGTLMAAAAAGASVVGASTLAPASASASIPQQPKPTQYFIPPRQAYSAGPVRPGSSAAANAMPFSKQTMSPGKMSGISPGESYPPPNFPPPTPPIPTDSDSLYGRSGSPSSSRPMLRKNFSSSSLKSIRSRNMSVTNLDDGSDMSPGTPLSNQFTLNSRLPALPSLPATAATGFKDRVAGIGGNGGMYLLESDFHSPTTPGSPNPVYSDAPVPLEPCPTDTMLRPFWLMRCLFQTLVHPRGGYVSNRLFVPNDVWKVRGVKLKNLDEKISNCDLLTAALLKLARVDTIDADAVLEEMQSLEGVLEHVQNVLTRKLGHEVGVQSANSLFKDASTGVDGEAVSGPTPRTTSMSSNSRSFSWRRLRPKNSSAGLGSGYSTTGRKESISEISAKDGGTLASLPMTQNPTSKPTKRDVSAARFTGPNANYMGALARLFDAAQSVDQIARQVEDPGLRHADKTQVGLELCTRHAAEFFAFYICRFVLSDVSLLLEKFVKRGSEWVLT